MQFNRKPIKINTCFCRDYRNHHDCHRHLLVFQYVDELLKQTMYVRRILHRLVIQWHAVHHLR
jgi:hypothetical protein